MTTYINELLQQVLVTGENYNELADMIYEYIIKNDESMYNYIVDAIQMLILQYTDKFILYQECEELYFTIKGFESVYNND